MENKHIHAEDGTCCIAGALVTYLVVSGYASSRERAAVVAAGVVLGVRVTMQSPEWAQALQLEDEERVGPEFTDRMRVTTLGMVDSVPMAREVSDASHSR